MHFLGMEKRLIWFEFEEKLTVNAHGIKLQHNEIENPASKNTIASNHPIGIEFSSDTRISAHSKCSNNNNETYVCTRSDIRCLETLTGKITKIIAIQVILFLNIYRKKRMRKIQKLSISNFLQTNVIS